MNKYSIEIEFGVHRGVIYEVTAKTRAEAFKKAERKFLKEYPDHPWDLAPPQFASYKHEK